MGTNVAGIGDYAFNGCTYLPNVTIPDSVTTIGDSAFAFCCSLISATIGNLISIGNSALLSAAA